jgi:hypothetical protein
MQTKTLTENNSIMPTTNIILSQEQLLQSQYLVNLPDDELKNILNSNDQNRINNYNYKEEMIKKKNEKDLKYLKELKKVYEKSPKLNLEILRSYNLKKGEILKIDAYGMIKSFRNKKDGYTYFGYYPNNRKNEVDFILKPIEENFEQRFIGKHFQIKFNPYDLKYYILDLGCGFGTFRKLIIDTIITDNFLINIGNSYIVFTYDDRNNYKNEEDKDIIKILRLKIFSGTLRSEQVLINPLIQNKIYIGRDSNNYIIIQDNLLSKIHCTVYFKDNLEWVIQDGYVNELNIIKPSTNGTWLMLNVETEIKNEMIFKSNQNLFKCKYVNS